MTRWIVLPLVAALTMTTSGFLNALERTTRESTRLAEVSEGAPRTSQEATDEVKDLPLIAELTGRQAQAFTGLADALELSARRVRSFGTAVRQQVDGVKEVATAIEAMRPEIACVEDKLVALVEAGASSPALLSDMTATLRSVVSTQNKSIRHLKSINRKLAALGVVATASGVEAPPSPGGAPTPKPGAAPEPLAC